MKNHIIKELKKIKVEKLDRDIFELKLFSDIKIDKKRVVLELNMQNDEIFTNFKDRVKRHFNNIKIDVKNVGKKSTNYGSSKNPNNRAPYAKKVIAVTSGKGGVGKSTVSVNLAISLAQMGYRVGILDADVYGPNVARMLGVESEKLQWEGDKILPSENFGLKIMSVALTTPQSDTPLIWRSSVAVSALIQFLEDVKWGELDFLVIDMPPGTGDVQLTIAQELIISSAVIVTTPQIVSTDDVSRAINMFKDIGVNIGGVVENMSYFIAPDTKQRYDIFGSGGGAMLSEKYSVKLLGEIPLEIDIREHSDSGKPIASFDKSKKYYLEIAKELV